MVGMVSSEDAINQKRWIAGYTTTGAIHMRLDKQWAQYIAHVAIQFGFKAIVRKTDERINRIRLYVVDLYQDDATIGVISSTIDYANFRLQHASTDMAQFKEFWNAVENQGDNDVKRI